MFEEAGDTFDKLIEFVEKNMLWIIIGTIVIFLYVMMKFIGMI